MFEDILKVVVNNDSIVVGIFSRINREIVRFLRNDMTCSHILVGRKELKEIYETISTKTYEDAIDPSRIITIKIIEVNEDSYFAGAYVPAKGEFQAKRIADLSA
jgi:hypothetical protein